MAVSTHERHQDALRRDIAHAFDVKYSQAPSKFVRAMMAVVVFCTAFLYFYLVLRILVDWS